MTNRFEFKTELFVKNVRCVASKKNIAIQDLERAVGVKIGYLNSLERTLSEPRVSTLCAFIRVLDVELEDLMFKDMELEETMICGKCVYHRNKEDKIWWCQNASSENFGKVTAYADKCEKILKRK